MLNAAAHFNLQGQPKTCEPYGEGHINQTYLLITDQEVWYILQKINHRVFKDVPALMENIAGVSRFLSAMDSDPRRVLTVVPTLQGADFHQDENGDYWRVYIFVRDSLCLQKQEEQGDFKRSGEAFGRFQQMLENYPADTLHATIPDFHNTPDRYKKLQVAINLDSHNRLSQVGEEVAFALARRDRAGKLQAMQKEGLLKTRVTHNDTKLNNVLLDINTREPLCVIDLDTVMPGLAAHDFGDSIRFGASTAAEDEKNLDLVQFSLPLYREYAEGFLSGCGKSLNQHEINTLPEGAWAMTLECGVRFLTDYLQGDVYFRTHREAQNLDRCRTQFKLVSEMEKNWAEMEKIISELTLLKTK
ncbi:MAG: aminoglycoside phosphotransferase family protein [Bacillota bacterium]|nr:aminoglycoside phosphotransferase family protein [Bacillota bacterium]